jgi:hypothetical protein
VAGGRETTGGDDVAERLLAALRSLGSSRWLLAGVLVADLLLWGRAARALERDLGLFGWLGNDFAYYYGQAWMMRDGAPDAMYHLPSLRDMRRGLIGVHGDRRMMRYKANQNPLPPLFFWLFRPLTHVPAPQAFAVWTAVNAACSLLLAWLGLRRLPPVPRRWWLLGVATSYPVGLALLFGQVQLLLTLALAAAYLALRRGRDLLAGLCLGAVLMKPQYLFLLGLVLLWKRRWLTVAATALVGLATAALSLAVSDPATMKLYVAAIRGGTHLRSDYPTVMINWRSVVLSLWPDIGDTPGMTWTLVAAAVTVAVALLAWRGPWRPTSPRFPALVASLLIATMLASHHSHPYGATILIAPLCDLVAGGGLGRLTRASVLALFAVPTLAYFCVDPFALPVPGRVLTACLLGCFACLLVMAWPRPEAHGDAGPPAREAAA